MRGHTQNRFSLVRHRDLGFCLGSQWHLCSRAHMLCKPAHGGGVGVGGHALVLSEQHALTPRCRGERRCPAFANVPSCFMGQMSSFVILVTPQRKIKNSKWVRDTATCQDKENKPPTSNIFLCTWMLYHFSLGSSSKWWKRFWRLPLVSEVQRSDKAWLYVSKNNRKREKVVLWRFKRTRPSFSFCLDAPTSTK